VVKQSHVKNNPRYKSVEHLVET